MARGRRLSASGIGRVLAELGSDVASKAGAEIATGGQTILTAAKARVPHATGPGTGALSATGHVEMNSRGNIATVVFDATSEEGYMYGKIVEFRPGHEHPFLYPAYDANRDNIRNKIFHAIREAVRAHAVP